MRAVSASLALLLSGALLTAQDGFKWDQIDDLGVKYLVFKKLERLPLKLGENDPHLRARYEPGGAGDYIHGARGSYSWDLNVYEFPKVVKQTTGKEAAKTPEEAAKEAVNRRTAANFQIWVTDGKDPRAKERKFKKKGLEVAGKGKKLPHKWWEYHDTQKMSNGIETFDQLWYEFAAVYDFPEREIALVLNLPVKRGLEPTADHRSWAVTMLTSLALLKDDGETGEVTHAKKDQHADTEKRREALSKAKANISDLPWWDYFTTPHYIVLFSWDKDKPEKRPDALKKATKIADDMEHMYGLYEQYYPPHEKMADYYSVMRICQSYEEFSKYGDSRGGVVGWFSPMTKELVFFVGGEVFAGKGFTNAVAFHEGWHQYCDKYFGTELHRWFDEGTGDFFGSFTWSGRKFDYATSKMRKLEVKQFVNSGEFVPVREIVTWNKDKFYGGRASDYYAQAYSMVDFLRNGKGNRALWDQAWDKVLDTYRQVALDTKDQKKAVEEAFRGVDWDKFQNAWIKWVKAY
jgi:hypothetical protein